jgi:hypothetical protein
VKDYPEHAFKRLPTINASLLTVKGVKLTPYSSQLTVKYKIKAHPSNSGSGKFNGNIMVTFKHSTEGKSKECR